jgi:hypothetical protein
LVAQPDQFDAALSGTKTRSFSPTHSWLANIVYLTMVPDDAGVIADVGDPYLLDKPLAAALDGVTSLIRSSAPAAKLRKAVPPAASTLDPPPSVGAINSPANAETGDSVAGAAENSTDSND